MALIVHGALLGILLGGAILMIYVYASARTRLHLVTLLFNGAGIAYMLCEGLIILVALSGDPVLGRQFHRLQALSIFLLILCIPPFVSVTVDLPPRWKKANQAVFGGVLAIGAAFGAAAFIVPDLFVSVDQAFRAVAPMNMRWPDVRGQTGPLYPLRDVLLVLLLLYLLAFFIYGFVKRQRRRYIILPIAGLIFIIVMGVLDILFLYTAVGALRFLRYFSSLTGFGIVAIITLSLISVVRRYQDESRGLEKARRFESLGTLAGGVAHDFNNLLTAVLGHLSLVREDRSLAREHRASLDEAAVAADRAGELARELLSLTRDWKIEKAVLEPAALLRQAAALVTPGCGIEATVGTAPDLKRIRADRSQVLRALENVVRNAIESMPEGGRLVLAAANAFLGPQSVPGLAAGDYVAFEIQDSGRGIDRDDLPRLFDPYWSTKGRSRGLGLTIAHRIVTLHDGHISVRSRAGAGTTVTVFLPATDDRPAETQDAPVPKRTPGGRVLYLEDEEIVARVGWKMLSSLGFEAETCATGEEMLAAFARAREERRPYAFLLLDIIIAQGLDGMTTMRELLKIDPDVKAVATSGYTEGDLPSNYRKYGFLAFLPKPFQLADVRKLAEQILRG